MHVPVAKNGSIETYSWNRGRSRARCAAETLRQFSATAVLVLLPRASSTGLALTCANRPVWRHALACASVSRVLLCRGRLAGECVDSSSGYTQVCGKKKGRLFTGPRLLIRKSLVRAQPGEPPVHRSLRTQVHTVRAAGSGRVSGRNAAAVRSYDNGQAGCSSCRDGGAFSLALTAFAGEPLATRRRQFHVARSPCCGRSVAASSSVTHRSKTTPHGQATVTR